jgi:CRP/FNR family transcriptional regulator, cyclic AMP receptor protein
MPVIDEHHATIADFIMDIPLFDELNSRELEIVADHMNFFEIDEDEVLFTEGDRGDYVCFVLKGSLDVVKETGVPGETVTIATITRKRSIGEMSVIDNTTRSATAIARSKTSLVALPQKSFNAILDRHPKTGIKILKGIARLMSLNMRKTSSRLADYMLPDC